MKNQKIIFSAPNKVEFSEMPMDLKIENPLDIIVRNHFSLISAGTELACLQGLESWFTLPGTPGYASVGEIIEVGTGISGFKTGDMVFTYGPHAGYFKITYGDRWSGLCVPIPEGSRPDLMVFTRMGQIAITALRISEIELGDLVAVTGLGPIGNLAAQLVRLQGGRVLGLDISNRRLEIAARCGLANALNSHHPDSEQMIREFTGHKGFDTYIDASGSSQVIEGFLKYIRLYGEAVLLGSPRTPYHTDLTPTLQHVHLWTHGSISLKGALEFRYPTGETEFVKHSGERNARIVMELIHKGSLMVEPFYTHLLHPSEAPAAYKGLREQKDLFIGVVFDWTK